jgi:integrase/recombinase XerD
MLYLRVSKKLSHMATVKIVLRKKQNSDGTYPLALRITKDRKSSYVYVGHNVAVSHWDVKNHRVKKSHPNAARLNNFLVKKLSEAEDNLLELKVQKNAISAKAIKGKIRASKEASFFAQAKNYLDALQKQGKYNRFNSDKSRIKAFRDFLDGNDIAFDDITVSLLNQYRAYLKGEKKLSEQTIVNHLTIIQTIFNEAIRNNLIDAKLYPYGRDKIRLKNVRSLKIGLSPEELIALEQKELEPASYADHARNLWLFAFYFAGMRISDVLRLKWTDFQNDRLFYAMGKNAKGGSLKVPDKALKILNLYRRDNPKHNLVFPDLEVLENLTDTYKVQKRIAYELMKLNAALKDVAAQIGITKKLTMHIARHTFGNLSGERIPIQMLQKLYRHTSITTTINYQANFIFKDADDALDSVIGI